MTRLILLLVTIFVTAGCCSKPAVVYKVKEVYIPIRCDIEIPPLPAIKDKPVDTQAVEIAKALEQHRRALQCCVNGACEGE